MTGPQTYHSSIPGSSFITPDGATHRFDGTGTLETSDATLIQELDKIADKPGCPIYKKRTSSNMPEELSAAGAEKVDPNKVKGKLDVDPVASALAGTLSSQNLATAK